jgi:hypothetical protein
MEASRAFRNLKLGQIALVRLPVRAMGKTAATTGETLHEPMISKTGAQRKWIGSGLRAGN